MAMRCLSCMKEINASVCPHCGYPVNERNEDHQLPVGTVLGDRYQLGKVLGQGGFGITYLGWDQQQNIPVAVKEFYPGGTVFRDCSRSKTVRCGVAKMIPHYEESKSRFLREASALRNFRRIPEIVDILDFVEENNTAYIVMEYIRGVNLAQYIQSKGGRLDVDETFRILRPVMEALAQVHKAGLVHRDISPDNIILDPMGGAKLLDFGAVRFVQNPDVEKGLTQSTEAILKHGFAPMEQYNAHGSLGPWTDEYAVCATIWYCLTGNVPEAAAVRLTEGIDPDWSGISGLARHQRRALEKGFSHRPKDRYPNMDSLLAALFPAPVMEKSSEASKSETSRATYCGTKETRMHDVFWHVGSFFKKPAVIAVSAVVFALIALMAIFGDTGDDTPVKLQEPASRQEYVGFEEPSDPIPNHPTGTPGTDPEPTEEPTEVPTEEPAPETEPEPTGEPQMPPEAPDTEPFVVPEDYRYPETIIAGHHYVVGITEEYSIIAEGKKDNPSDELDVGEWNDRNIVAVSAGHKITVGLCEDGTVLFLGNGADYYSEEAKNKWRDIVSVSAGFEFVAGLTAEGEVLVIKNTGYSVDFKETKNWDNVVAISAGYNHIVALLEDGTVVTAGGPSEDKHNTGGWTDIIAISAGSGHTVGLTKYGKVLYAGDDPRDKKVVEAWDNIVAISAGRAHTVGLRKVDSTEEYEVVCVGHGKNGEFAADSQHQGEVEGWSDIIAISAGDNFTVGLTSEGTVRIAENANNDAFIDRAGVKNWRNILVPKPEETSQE